MLQNEEDNGFVAYEAYEFKVLLYDAYHQIRFYGQNDAAVMVGLLKSLRFAKAKASPANIRVINEYTEQFFTQLQHHGFDPLAAAKIEKEYNDLTDYRKMAESGSAAAADTDDSAGGKDVQG